MSSIPIFHWNFCCSQPNLARLWSVRAQGSDIEHTETDVRSVLQPIDHGPLQTSSWDSEKLQLRSEEHVELALASSDGAPLVDLKVEAGGEGRVPGPPERPGVPVEGSPSAQAV